MRQPWATLLVCGHKLIETRGWGRFVKLGPILIHASAKFSQEDKDRCKKYPFNLFIRDANKLPLGAIIGMVNIDAIFQSESLTSLSKIETAFGDYSPKRYGWICSKAAEFADPIPAKGKLSIWQYEGPLPELPKGVTI